MLLAISIVRKFLHVGLQLGNVCYLWHHLDIVRLFYTRGQPPALPLKICFVFSCPLLRSGLFCTMIVAEVKWGKVAWSAVAAGYLSRDRDLFSYAEAVSAVSWLQYHLYTYQGTSGLPLETSFKGIKPFDGDQTWSWISALDCSQFKADCVNWQQQARAGFC